MPSCIIYNVGGVFVSIVLPTKAGKWRITGISGANVLCTVCNASSPSWIYARLLSFLLLAGLFLKVGVSVSLKLADYDIEWKHLHVESFTIDMKVIEHWHTFVSSAGSFGFAVCGSAMTSFLC